VIGHACAYVAGSGRFAESGAVPVGSETDVEPSERQKAAWTDPELAGFSAGLVVFRTPTALAAGNCAPLAQLCPGAQAHSSPPGTYTRVHVSNPPRLPWLPPHGSCAAAHPGANGPHGRKHHRTHPENDQTCRKPSHFVISPCCFCSSGRSTTPAREVSTTPAAARRGCSTPQQRGCSTSGIRWPPHPLQCYRCKRMEIELLRAGTQCSSGSSPSAT
jgi:hypothetical protein